MIILGFPVFRIFTLFIFSKVEKALEETARELEKSQKKPDGNAGVTSKPSTKPATSGIYKGVPQALLDKVCKM